jgi:Domain of unknown function (DUF4404)
MPEPSNSGSPAAAQVRAYLHTIAELLREVPHLGPEAQGLLAELVAELSDAMDAETVPAADLAHLADTAAQLVRAAHRGEHHGILGKAQEKLEAAAATLEADAPMIAGLTRRLIEALSNLGI